MMKHRVTNIGLILWLEEELGDGFCFSAKKPLEKVCFIYKMTGLAMVRPASSDLWTAPLENSCLPFT